MPTFSVGFGGGSSGGFLPGGINPNIPLGGQPTGSGGVFNTGSILTNILQAVGLGSSVLGGILNRPKGLSNEQKRILDQLLAQLSAQASAPLSINPQERAGLFEQIAGSAQGARNRIKNDFASRGLSESGLQGEEMGRVERTQQSAQTAADLDLLRGARSERTGAQNQLQSLLFGIPATQGASAAGVGLSSVGEVLGYLLTLQQMGRR